MLPDMNKMLFAALAAALFAAQVTAQAASPADELRSRQYLLGTWNCSYTVGKEGGSYTTTWTTALEGRWLKQTYDQPARRGEPGFKAEYLIGYDEQSQGWVRFGAMTTGQYFAIRMRDSAPGGWTWNYVNFFRPVRPSTSTPDATFTKKSDTEYAVDGPTYKENSAGPAVTEHHICKKQ